MNQMNAEDIRKAYLDFFQNKDHALIPRASLVPQNDPTTLFTGSGMQPLLPYLLGQEHPQGTKLTDSQTCLRAEDIEEVGDNRHTTFFEMLGNWSLGEYFKAEQLPWFFEFLVDIVGLDPGKLYVTCYSGDPENGIPKDEESAKIWQELFQGKGVSADTANIGTEEEGAKRGMQDGERVFFYQDKNWWSRVGAPSHMTAGEPGGPDSEMFYLFEEIEHDPNWGKHCHPNCDCGRFMEIGNSVFMEYIKKEDGSFGRLPKRNVDFGGGLERIAAAAIDSPDVFKISLMWPVIERLQKLSGKQYEKHTESMRVITDHLRAATFLGVDGVIPSNTQQGYVMRRLLRRAIRYSLDLDFSFNVCEEVVPIIVQTYKPDFPEIADQEQHLIDLMIKEEKVFRQTLRAGVRHFRKEVGLNKPGETATELTGDIAFKLYDTFGFPWELSLEEAQKNNVPVAKDWREVFEQRIKEQRERSRTATKGQFKGGLQGTNTMHVKYHTTTHIMYRALRQVLGDHVEQRGSNITEERTRFDFNHPERMTPDQIKQVEDIVNDVIHQDLPVAWEEMPTDQALASGARGHFGEKYGETSKVYIIGPKGNPWSMELCGGPHVEHTGKLGEGGKRFKIKKEQSSSAGIRRIKAVLE